MNFDTQYKAAKAARAFIATMTAQAHGWDTPKSGIKAPVGDQVFIYGFDSISGGAWMASVSLASFRAALGRVSSDEAQWDEYRANTEAYLAAMGANIHGTPIPKESRLRIASLNGDQLNPANLITFIAGYAGTTEVAIDPESIEPGTHFIAIRYPASIPEARVRFFVAGANEDVCVMPLVEFEAIVNDVTQSDFESHPEWFA